MTFQGVKAGSRHIENNRIESLKVNRLATCILQPALHSFGCSSTSGSALALVAREISWRLLLDAFADDAHFLLQFAEAVINVR